MMQDGQIATDRAAILALIANLEKAARPSREMCERISRALGISSVRHWWVSPQGREVANAWLYSVDAALTTVPEGWASAILRQLPSGGFVAFLRRPGASLDAVHSDLCATLPIAIVIASLRARLADMEGADG